jgi:hypothetical protein
MLCSPRAGVNSRLAAGASRTPDLKQQEGRFPFGVALHGSLLNALFRDARSGKGAAGATLSGGRRLKLRSGAVIQGRDS